MGETANQEAFQRELSRARQFNRGDWLGTASFACENDRCAVGVVRIGFVEALGTSALPFQWPLAQP